MWAPETTRCPHPTKRIPIQKHQHTPPLEQNNHNTPYIPTKSTNTKTSDPHHTKPKRYTPKNQNPQNTRQNPVTNITPTLPPLTTPSTFSTCHPPLFLVPLRVLLLSAVICCYLLLVSVVVWFVICVLSVVIWVLSHGVCLVVICWCL